MNQAVDIFMTGLGAGALLVFAGWLILGWLERYR